MTDAEIVEEVLEYVKDAMTSEGHMRKMFEITECDSKQIIIDSFTTVSGSEYDEIGKALSAPIINRAKNLETFNTFLEGLNEVN